MLYYYHSVTHSICMQGRREKSYQGVWRLISGPFAKARAKNQVKTKKEKKLYFAYLWPANRITTNLLNKCWSNYLIARVLIGPTEFPEPWPAYDVPSKLPLAGPGHTICICQKVSNGKSNLRIVNHCYQWCSQSVVLSVVITNHYKEQLVRKLFKLKQN